MAVAITYESGPKARDLRTVLVEDVHQSTVLLPTGALDVTQAKLLHGTACRCSWWAEQLGTEPESDDFIVSTAQIVAKREMAVAVKTHHKH